MVVRTLALPPLRLYVTRASLHVSAVFLFLVLLLATLYFRLLHQQRAAPLELHLHLRHNDKPHQFPDVQCPGLVQFRIMKLAPRAPSGLKELWEQGCRSSCERSCHFSLNHEFSHLSSRMLNAPDVHCPGLAQSRIMKLVSRAPSDLALGTRSKRSTILVLNTSSHISSRMINAPDVQCPGLAQFRIMKLVSRARQV